MKWSAVVLVVSFCAAVSFLRGAWRVFRSPEFRRDIGRLREQRLNRAAARRGR